MHIEVIRVGLKPNTTKKSKKNARNALAGGDWDRIHELVVKLTKEDSAIEHGRGIDRGRMSRSNLDWYVERKLDFINWAGILCDDFDEIVGVCLFQKGPLAYSCSLAALYVEKAYRGHGYGKELLKTCLEEMKRHYKFVDLNTSSFNDVALRLYGKTGFAPYRVDMLLELKKGEK